jgi:hypothetical protein
MDDTRPKLNDHPIAVLARIDNNVRWIRNIGGAVIMVVFSALSFLYLQDGVVREALADLNSNVAVVSERLDNHIERTQRDAK